MSKHTPGPWRWVSGTELRGRRQSVVLEALPRGVARLDMTPANARLIAAAPELLDALELNLVEQGRAGAEFGLGDTPGMIAARAAIAKAQGGKT